jgi:hypothetical protein
MYKDDLSSENAKTVNSKPEELHPPRLADVRQEFEQRAS